MAAGNYKTLIVVLCCLLASCVKDKPDDVVKLTPSSGSNIYVPCEGRFMSGDASLYTYQPVIDSVFGDIYKSTNNQPLGDVFQSMVRIGDKLFLCINNSDKVVVLNSSDWSQVASIPVPKPRYMMQVSASRAFVTSEYSNKVYVINPQSLAVIDTFSLPSTNTEGMCLYDNYTYICTWDTACNVLYKVDAGTGLLAQKITIAGSAPKDVLMDKYNLLWVLSGNKQQGKRTIFTRIDPSSGNIVGQYQFPADADVIKPVFNKSRDTLYFIEVDYNGGTVNNGIYRMPVTSLELPTQPFIAAKQYQYFYALGIDPITGNIFVGDPKGFIQKGSVSVYQPDGKQVKSFSVGMGPGHFYFDE
jgi:DNA-binding beta-propeller fold protein YncE